MTGGVWLLLPVAAVVSLLLALAQGLLFPADRGRGVRGGGL